MPETALIIDSDMEERQKLSAKLQDTGWVVVQADGYNEGKYFLRRPELTLIVFNNLMPTLSDGKKLMNEIRGFNSKIYVAVLSPIKNQSTIVEFMNLGANDYFVKPLDIDIIFWKLNLRFKFMPAKDFAKINLAEQESSVCYFDLRSEIASFSESGMEIYTHYYIEPKSRISVNSGFLKGIGMEEDYLEFTINDVRRNTDGNSDRYRYVINCQMLNMTEENMMLIRRWLISCRAV